MKQFNSLRVGARSTTTVGLPLAVLSAAAFGTSGAFAKSLFTVGWSPLAAVTARIAIAALVLAIPTAVAMRGRWHLIRTNISTIMLYGVAGVAGIQLLYFLAVQRLSVGVALMLEYLSPVLLVLLTWATTRRVPARATIAGTVAALLGLALVLDVLGEVRLDAVGVVFALGAAVCSATYFVVAASTREDSLPALALTGIGLGVGLLSLLIVALTGLLPFDFNATPVELAGIQTSVLTPLVGLGVIAAALAYVTGSVSARILGSRVASFVALSEVMFAVVFAWIMLGEIPHLIQLLGGVLIVAGVILVRLAERQPTLPVPVPDIGGARAEPVETNATT